MPSPEEQRLLARFLAGEAGAVARVSHWARGVISGRGYYVPAVEQEDLLQETVIHVFKAASASGFALHQTMAAFVRSVAHRRCVDWLRCRRDERPMTLAATSSTERPDQSLLERERTERATRVLTLLGESCRRLIELRVGDGLPYRTIARRLGRSEGGVRNQMYKCLQRARKLMQDREREQGARAAGTDS